MGNVATVLKEFRGKDKVEVRFEDLALYDKYSNNDDLKPEYWDRMHILQINMIDLVGKLNDMVCEKGYVKVERKRLKQDDYIFVVFYVDWSDDEVMEIKEVSKDYVTLIT